MAKTGPENLKELAGELGLAPPLGNNVKESETEILPAARKDQPCAELINELRCQRQGRAVVRFCAAHGPEQIDEWRLRDPLCHFRCQEKRIRVYAGKRVVASDKLDRAFTKFLARKDPAISQVCQQHLSPDPINTVVIGSKSPEDPVIGEQEAIWP